MSAGSEENKSPEHLCQKFTSISCNFVSLGLLVVCFMMKANPEINKTIPVQTDLLAKQGPGTLRKEVLASVGCLACVTWIYAMKF